MNWISVNDHCPKINGRAVLVAGKVGDSTTIFGAARYTTDHGDIYKDHGSGPVWELWCPHFSETGVKVIGPSDVTHWMEMPEFAETE